MLKGIGTFIESLDDDILPAPQWLVVSDSRLAAVADYLDSGLVYKKYRGYSWCRFGCDIPSDSMGSCELTDGLWVWPEGLSHYLRCHSVGLPEDFMVHALSGYLPKEIGSHTPPDYSCWVSWASAYRSVEMDRQLADARKEDLRLVAIAKAEHIAAMTLRHGESSDGCLFSGCEKRALKGMRICALHSLPANTDSQFHSRSSQLLRRALQPSQPLK